MGMGNFYDELFKGVALRLCPKFLESALQLIAVAKWRISRDDLHEELLLIPR